MNLNDAVVVFVEVFGGAVLLICMIAAFRYTYLLFRGNLVLRRAILSTTSVDLFTRYWPFAIFWIGLVGSQRYVAPEYRYLVIQQRWNSLKWLVAVICGAAGGALQDYAMYRM